MAVSDLKVDLRPQIGRMNISSSNDVSGALTGSYLTSFKGRGLEFGGFRKYNQMADDATQIDWKASLRAGETVVREIEEERNINVLFMFDVSTSMLCASADKMKAEYAIEMAATMAFAILRAGDSVGLEMFNTNIVTSLSPNMGEEQYMRIIQTLTNTEHYGGDFDFTHALERVALQFKHQKAILVIFSDFIGVRGTRWEDYIKNLATNYDIIPIMVKDPVDTHLPDVNERFIIQDPFAYDQIAINPSEIKEQYELYARQQENAIIESFRKYNVKVLKRYTTEPYLSELVRYIQEKGS